MRQLTIWLFVLMASPGWFAQAQWLNYPTPGSPRTKDGKPNLTARAPRTRDGKPDLSGVWHVQATTREEWKKILGDGLEAVPGIQPVRVPGGQQPAPEPLQLRVPANEFHQPLAQAPASMRFEDIDVGQVGKGGPITDHPGKPHLLPPAIDAEGE